MPERLSVRQYLVAPCVDIKVLHDRRDIPPQIRLKRWSAYKAVLSVAFVTRDTVPGLGVWGGQLSERQYLVASRVDIKELHDHTGIPPQRCRKPRPACKAVLSAAFVTRDTVPGLGVPERLSVRQYLASSKTSTHYVSLCV